MKGFLFSIEALFSMAIIVLAIGIVQYNTTQTPTNEPAILLQNQNNQLTTLYFNLPQTNSDPTTTNQYCAKIIQYDTSTKIVNSKSICRGIK